MLWELRRSPDPGETVLTSLKGEEVAEPRRKDSGHSREHNQRTIGVWNWGARRINIRHIADLRRVT